MYNPQKLMGVTTLDVCRAKTFVAENQGRIWTRVKRVTAMARLDLVCSSRMMRAISRLFKETRRLRLRFCFFTREGFTRLVLDPSDIFVPVTQAGCSGER